MPGDDAAASAAAGAPPSLFVLAAASALQRCESETASYGETVAAVVAQNSRNGRGKELEIYLRPPVIQIDSPPRLHRRPKLVRQNAFRAPRDGPRSLPPPPPAAAAAIAFVDVAPGGRRAPPGPLRHFAALAAALHRFFRRGGAR